MIKVSVLYPNMTNISFDTGYYYNRHIPMVRQLLGAALKHIAVEEGISAIDPGSQPPYRVLAHLTFDSVEAFQQSFAPHANAIMSDIPKYTNSQPTVQISEVKVDK